MVAALCQIKRVRLQTRAAGDRPESAAGDAAELHGPLSQIIGELAETIRDFIEQGVKGNKVWAFYIPVRLLRLKPEIDRVGKVFIENVDDSSARFLRQVVLSLKNRGVQCVTPAVSKTLGAPPG